MDNAISLVNKDLQNHLVTVTLPGEEIPKKLFLIEVGANTSMLEDYRLTYGKVITDLHSKIAKKIFGEKKTDNTYGIFIDRDLKIVFAFNRQFADYDKKSQQIQFKNVDDVIAEKVEPIEIEWEEISTPPRPPRPVSPGSGVLRYSLIEKKQ